MDYRSLVHIAKKNSDGATATNGKYYNTKYAPPKKETREKTLSENIKKFLAQKAHEEREQERLRKEKLDQLLAARDQKAKNKIRKMLKVTKSANRSVLDDVKVASPSESHRFDLEDYDYVSDEAKAFFRKYVETADVVKDVKDVREKVMLPITKAELNVVRDRVVEAIDRNIKVPGTRIRTKKPKEDSRSEASGTTSRPIEKKKLYDPKAEKELEEKRKREEAQKRRTGNKKQPAMDFQALLKLAEKMQSEPVVVVAKNEKPEKLLTEKQKLQLEKRQEEFERRKMAMERSRLPRVSGRENQIMNPASNRFVTPDDPELVINQKQQLANRQEEFERRKMAMEMSRPGKTSGRENRTINRTSNQFVTPEARLSASGTNRIKLSEEMFFEPEDPESVMTQKQKHQLDKRQEEFERRKMAMEMSRLPRVSGRENQIINQTSNRFATPDDPELVMTQKQNHQLNKRQEAFERRKMAMERSRLAKPQGKENQTMNPNGQLPTLNQTARPKAILSATTSHSKSSNASSSSESSKDSSSGARSASNGSTSSIKDKHFAAALGKLSSSSSKLAASLTLNGSKTTTDGTTRKFPPTETNAKHRPASVQSTTVVRRPNKRRFIDTDDEDEYDSDLDDFIDDGSDTEDYSKHIKAIFGYDKSKYRHIDEEDDTAMESSFAQQMREEQISKKLGLKEDLEDMRKEAEEKKRKAMKRRKLH